jgi:hypothetical protein
VSRNRWLCAFFTLAAANRLAGYRDQFAVALDLLQRLDDEIWQWDEDRLTGFLRRQLDVLPDQGVTPEGACGPCRRGSWRR